MIVILSFLIILNNKSSDYPVFSQDDNNNYDIYNLDLSKINITTKNILVFKDYGIDILKIVPVVNSSYSDKIPNNYKNFNTNNSTIVSNIKTLEEKLLDYIKKYGTTDEYLDSYINGIKIDSINVYCSNNALENIKRIYKDIDFKSLM